VQTLVVIIFSTSEYNNFEPDRASDEVHSFLFRCPLLVRGGLLTVDIRQKVRTTAVQEGFSSPGTYVCGSSQVKKIVKNIRKNLYRKYFINTLEKSL
jgi:hypothetical protein